MRIYESMATQALHRMKREYPVTYTSSVKKHYVRNAAVAATNCILCIKHVPTAAVQESPRQSLKPKPNALRPLHHGPHPLHSDSMTTNDSLIIQVDNYGDLIAKMREMDLIYYSPLGSYQGDYLAVLLDRETSRIFIYKDYYGSCSGCDWLESESIGGGVEYKTANDFCSQMKPLYILPARDYSPEEISQIIGIKDSYDFTFTTKNATEISESITKVISKIHPHD